MTVFGGSFFGLEEGSQELKNDFFLAGFFASLQGINTLLVLPKKALVFLLNFCIVEGPRERLVFDLELPGQVGMLNLGRPPDLA